MIRDARELTAGTTLEAGICVVGGGPAGMALALELRRAGLPVTLLEGGGIDADPSAQSLSGGEQAGDHYHPLENTRWRQLGGTAHLWNSRAGSAHGFRAGPLDACDFRERDWIPGSDWPIDAHTLERHYRADFSATYAVGGGDTQGCGHLPPAHAVVVRLDDELRCGRG